MQAGLSVERVMGGMERTNLTADEKKQIKTD